MSEYAESLFEAVKHLTTYNINNFAWRYPQAYKDLLIKFKSDKGIAEYFNEKYKDYSEDENEEG